MESEFEDLKDVSDVVSGYAGLETQTPPTYESVSTGRSGYVEAVRVTYDPAVVSYESLLEIFWGNVDPFDAEGQFCDKGAQYLAAIYYASPEEERLARESLKKMEEKHGREIVTAIAPREEFYEAEAEHQDYASRNAVRYALYKNGCGRPARLEELKESVEQK
jgi:peptide-methionine (S)-S-oxide reductase